MLIPFELFDGSIVWLKPTKKTMVIMVCLCDGLWETHLDNQGDSIYTLCKGEKKTNAFRMALSAVEKINMCLECKGNKNA
jgi:hypothetical protein